MTVEEVQSELGLDEDGKLTVTMGECAVPVDVATANLQYMHVATERLQQKAQEVSSSGRTGAPLVSQQMFVGGGLAAVLVVAVIAVMMSGVLN